MHGGAEPVDGTGNYNRPGSWVAFVAAGERSRGDWVKHDIDDSEIFETVLWHGNPVAGFASDPAAELPRDLVQGADLKIEMSVPTAADITAAVCELTGSAPTILLTEEVGTLTPRLLRLARRPGQTADAYIGKLVDVLAQEANIMPLASPSAFRDAPTLDRLYGMDEAVTWGISLAEAFRAYRANEIPWADVDAGCLLSGPPGCGKTIWARALASTCGVPLISGSYGQWLGTGTGHQGDLLKAMARAFSEAKRQAPAIVFIDEIDSFPDRGMVTHANADWEIQVVNALLAHVDDVERREGVVVIGACNHSQKLDPALIRSGRLARHIRISLPGRYALEKILREHLGADLPTARLSTVALAMAGASGADCERLVMGARRRAREAGRKIRMKDLTDEIEGNDERTGWELHLAAVHESGHAIALCDLNLNMLESVSLRARGSTGRGMVSVRKRSLMVKSDLQRRLFILLAGRAVEKATFGEPSSGAGGTAESDLALATKLAATPATALGLDDDTGLVWSGALDAADLPGKLAEDPALAGRVRAALDRAYSEELILMRGRRAAINALADALLERRSLGARDVISIVERFPVATAADREDG